MWKSYLKISWRNIHRQPIYTILNLACLALGIAAAIIILLYLDFELNFDRFHEKKDRIFRIETTAIQTHNKTVAVDWDQTPAPFGVYLKQDFPEVENITRFYRFFQNENVAFDFNGKITEESQLMVADASLLDVFSFEFIHGNKQTALVEPNKIILSKSLARRIFGEQNPLGKVLQTELNHILPDVASDYNLMVSGVYKDFPDNSHIPANAFIAAATDPQLANYEIGRFSFYTYALLKGGIAPDQLTEKLPTIYQKYIDPAQEPVMKYAEHELIPLPNIHLHETGGYNYIYIFAAVGLLVLLIAMISYVNLVTAQASRRALEIGVRKVLGSDRQQLIVQFLGESFFLTFLAVVIAVMLVVVAVAPLNTLLDLQLSTQQILQPQLLAGVFGILLLLGILGGTYPAFFLANFQPIAIMKGKTAKNVPLRKSLVAIQFGVVLAVLVSTGMIYEQLQFMQQKDLGFNRTEIVQLNLGASEAIQKAIVLKEKILQQPTISKVGTSNFLPGISMARRPLSADNGTSRESQFVHFGEIDDDFFTTMDIELVAGRKFTVDNPADATDNLIVNETLARQFGLKNPVGEKVRYGDQNNPNFKMIIGVVKDFHQSSLHQAIGPQIFLRSPENYYLFVKVEGGIADGLDQIKQSWADVFPNATFDYRFLDESLQASYETDQIRGNIFLLFSLLTIFITFLGLFGLVAYTTQQRVKEIGIRKVLGANLRDLVMLVSKDFVRLTLIAATPAFLGAWYFRVHWLQDFAFRSTFNPFLLVGVLCLVVLFTLAITSLHAVRVGRLNPAETLKTE
ncbi:MAG: ABC transporter permease [Bacteroidota bacterium]